MKILCLSIAFLVWFTSAATVRGDEGCDQGPRELKLNIDSFLSSIRGVRVPPGMKRPPTADEILDELIRVASNGDTVSDLKFITQLEMNELLRKILEARLTVSQLYEMKERVRSLASLPELQKADALEALSEILSVRGPMEQYEIFGHPHFGRMKCWMAIHAKPETCLPSDSPSRNPEVLGLSKGNPDDRMVVGFCDNRTNWATRFRKSRRCEVHEVSRRYLPQER